MSMKFKFKPNAESIYVMDYWDCLFEGYINLEKILEYPEQIEAVNNAIKILKGFIHQAVDAEIIEGC